MITRISNWYFSRKALPYWCIFVLDCLIVLLSNLVAYALHHSELYTFQHFGALTLTFLGYQVPYVVAFRLFHTYAGVIRYSSFIDLQRISFALATGCALNIGLKFLVMDEWGMPVGVIDLLAGALLGMTLIWSVRVVVKYLYEAAFQSPTDLERVFIYGVKNGGMALAKSILNEEPSRYELVGFVSDGTELPGRYLLGARVYFNDEHLVENLINAHVRTLLVSPLKNELLRNNPDMVERLVNAEVKIRMFPAEQEWDGKSELTHSQLHEVEIEDLLPRDKIEVDLPAIGALLKGQKILITGAAGSIGSEMVRQVATFGPAELVLIDQAETPMHDVRLLMARRFPHIACQTIVTSIANAPHMERIFHEHRPDYVFHAAAYKHVPMMEDNPAIAVQNNIYGTRVIADLAVKYGTKKFVMISTDKAVNPTNVMGCSKRICEIYCQSLNNAIAAGKVVGDTQFVTTRFGNVLGSNGSVIPIFKEQIKKGGPLTVTHPDIIRYFMLIPEACRLVLEAGTMGQGGEIFVFDMGKPVKIVDLAKRMIQLSGAKDIEIQFSGLRDGEKLYEELLSTQENTKPTHHPKILVAQVREYDYETACRNEECLLEASRSFDDMAIVKIMKEIVPEFKSQHSKYQALDQ